ncbi:MAG: DNA adenine methylase [Methanomicrobiales archaeon]|nr:DNA adenine methylase [Methanomicrobiales archaeon]MDI6876584.1 DNA adenine methylase [Methanomicrobiales archaeon]
MAERTGPGPEARPFLKWAGGKTQILQEISARLPPELREGKIAQYVEPFVGGGAVFFYLNRRFSFERCCICDANEELVLLYRVVKRSVDRLVQELQSLEAEYLSKSRTRREAYYYEVRSEFNQKRSRTNFRKYQADWIERAARIVFLNRTCYNGLFRVNRNGEFNVPFGRYENPEILNADNLRNAAALLKTTRIILGDFTRCKRFVDNSTFVYLDPPYRPLSGTASFTNYSRHGFTDGDQMRLAEFFRELDTIGAKIMLSNSDPKNEDPGDSFFDDLYSGYCIERVPAKRMINCNGRGRGEINELIITNYRTQGM